MWHSSFLVSSLGVDLFRLGTAFILLALMFPLIEAVDKYVDTETAAVTLILWLIGILLIFISAFIIVARHSRRVVVSGS